MAVTRLRFHSSGSGKKYIDLAQGLSLQARKLHRQKNLYTVYGGYYVDSNGSRIDINVAPNTWVTKRAVNRGFAMWRKMIARTLAEASGTGTGKWNDFKVYLKDGHISGNSLLPVDGDDQNIYATGVGPEWTHSLLTTEDPDGPGGTPADQYNLMIAGNVHTGSDPNWLRIGLIKSWLESRPGPQTEDPQSANINPQDPLMNLFDASDVLDDRIQVIRDSGDEAPYDENSMFGLANASNTNAGANLQRVSTAITTAANAVVPVHGFEAVCGLIEVDVVGDPGQWELVLDVESNGVKF